MLKVTALPLAVVADAGCWRIDGACAAVAEATVSVATALPGASTPPLLTSTRYWLPPRAASTARITYVASVAPATSAQAALASSRRCHW